MRLTADQVKKVAKLASLPISEADEDKYSDQLSKILGYIDQLNSVDTKGIGPTYNVTGLENVTRSDEVGESLTQEEATQNSSNHKQGYFVTKGVFESD